MGKMPFKKNEHADLIKAIALGIYKSENLVNYLELGIRKGPVFNAVAPLAKRAYAVDINASCHRFIKTNKNLTWFCGTTNKFFKKLDPKIKFDLVFIDADHSHKSSFTDFKNVISHLKYNSVVLLHDTYPPRKAFTSKKYCADTYKTAWKIRQEFSEEFELVTMPFYFGVSIIRKANKQLNWL